MILLVTGLVLLWAYQPSPHGPEALRTVHRLASALLLPASWVLVVTMVRARWGSSGSPLVRWGTPALFVAAVPVAAFTGFLLPWTEVFYAAAVVPEGARGLGPVFDGAVATLSFGGEPIAQQTVQRYALAHLFAGALVTALALVLFRATARTRRGRASPPPGTGSGPDPRTTG